MNQIETLMNEACDAYETVRDKLQQILGNENVTGEVVAEIDANAKHFVSVQNALDDIYSAIEDAKGVD